MDRELPKAVPPQLQTDNMSFLDHLEELRWRIIKGLGGVLLGIIVAFIYSDFFIDTVLLGPVYKDFFVYQWIGLDAVDISLQNRRLPGQFFTYWGTLFVVGFIIGSPLFIYQLWKFIEPALESKEKRRTRFTAFSITGLFLAGVTFGYTVLVPFAVQFFAQFQLSDSVRNDIDITAYFSAVTMWIVACGIIFQLPMVSYTLSKVGILTPEFMIKYRKLAIVMCFVLAAFITPPDPVSQFLIGIPLFLLYQLGIYISRYVNKKRDKEIWGASGKP
ncbi:Sec-independent protein translocase TatC [Cyclonatronum proteinivorum]|uniref:Sec-independent protein translocase protein TatC n=2 Tax=Cyclonatronum proteinivorum TaxID=1457365 RepID=A0A345UJ45_9BACT|nr:Sec-independent protein translocase TatC [Cyclonatronum proteinivorum]